MGTVVRAGSIFVVMLVLFRIAGRRTLSQMTNFDLVLLLVISEAVQEAMLDGDHSMTSGLLAIVTLVLMNVAISVLKRRWPWFERLVDGMPLVLIENGRPLRDRMHNARVDEDEILIMARQSQGIERLDQIKYAVLERSGGISIVPKDRATR